MGAWLEIELASSPCDACLELKPLLYKASASILERESLRSATVVCFHLEREATVASPEPPLSREFRPPMWVHRKLLSVLPPSSSFPVHQSALVAMLRWAPIRATVSRRRSGWCESSTSRSMVRIRSKDTCSVKSIWVTDHVFKGRCFMNSVDSYTSRREPGAWSHELGPRLFL
jgi:hypothetical protein